MLCGPVETFGKRNSSDRLLPRNGFSEPPLEVGFFFRFSILLSLWKHTGVQQTVSTMLLDVKRLYRTRYHMTSGRHGNGFDAIR